MESAPSHMHEFLVYVMARELARANVSDAAFGRAAGWAHRSSAKHMLDGRSGYAREGIDPAVNAVAELTGTPQIELWAMALREWRKDPDATYLRDRHAGLRAARLEPAATPAAADEA